jgi:hypothetical protein
MHTLRRLLPIVALSAVLAACGGGGSSSAGLKGSDVAVVGDQHITTADFDAVLAQAQQSYKTSGQAFPKQGTSAYESVKSQALTGLVQGAERAAEAKKMGITITDKQVQTRVDQIKKQYFQSSETKYQAALKKYKLTDAQLRKDIHQQLVEEKLYAQLTKNATVSDAAAKTYYQQHLSLYAQKKSRDVQYMLIKKKALATSLYAQLKANDTKALFCKLAKKYSGDPSTKSNCGKATFSQGQTVKAFDTVLFTQPIGVTHAPVYDATSYKAYFLIRPLTATHPGKTTPFSQVKATIKQTLTSQAQKDAVNSWFTKVQKSYCSGSKIKYQVGYTPNPDPCAALTSSNTTTT